MNKFFPSEINMKILVTGVEGYIGSVLGEVLLKYGFDVVGLDTGFYKSGQLFNGIKMPQVIAKDIRKISLSDLRGFEAIVHLAELSNDPLGQNNPTLTYQINHKASVRLAKLAKKAGIKRFVYMSSCSVYGIATEDMVSEQSKPNPQTVYAKCKLLVEKDVSKLADKNFSPTFFRSATAYGASPRQRFDLVVNDLAALAYTTREITMSSDGTPWRPFIHIRDISEAISLALKSPREKVHNQIMKLGSSRSNYQIKEVAQIIGSVFKGCKIALGKPNGDTRSYKVSFEKIKKILPEFRCKYDIKKGAEELKKVFENIRLNAQIYRSLPFTRINQIKYLIDSKQVDNELFWRSNCEI